MKGVYNEKKLLSFGSVIVALSLMLIIVLPTASMVAAVQPYKWQYVKIEGGVGYIQRIVFNQTEKNLVYARTYMDGAFRSADGGSTWFQHMNWVGYEDWELAGVESLTTDPVAPGFICNAVYIPTAGVQEEWFGAPPTSEIRSI